MNYSMYKRAVVHAPTSLHGAIESSLKGINARDGWSLERRDRSTVVTASDFIDVPPDGDALTDYDRTHVKLYIRLLDAKAAGAHWEQIAMVLFGLDSNREPERARRVHDAHLARATWMTHTGYRHLLRRGAH